MNIKFFKSIFFLLLFACIVTSCSGNLSNFEEEERASKDTIPINDPPFYNPRPPLYEIKNDTLAQKKILGKWEEIAFGPREDYMWPVTSKESYIEFFPNGSILYQHPETGDYMEGFFKTYVIDNEFLILNYDITYDLGRHDHKYEYIDNLLKTTCIAGWHESSMFAARIVIYQRVN